MGAGVPPSAQVQPLVSARQLGGPFDYAVPDDLSGAAQRGALVACSLGRRVVAGVVLSREPASYSGTLSPLSGVIDAPSVPAELLDLAAWVGSYYRAPAGAALKLVLPPGADGAVRKGPSGYTLSQPPGLGAEVWVARASGNSAGDVSARHEEVLEVVRAAGGELAASKLIERAETTMPTLQRMSRSGLLELTKERRSTAVDPIDDWVAGAPQPREAVELTLEQRAALEAIDADLAAPAGGRLLFGVTGSGKTEVYIRAIEAARKRGRTALVLVPEIALTPQMLDRLRGRLGAAVAIWHSGLTLAQRRAQYDRVRSGVADVVVGARSAVFAPLPALGLVVVDEEHDPSYKQDATPRYDARQVAWRRAQEAQAALVYGSATPRPESWARLPRVELPRRADRSAPSPVEIVDMRKQGPGPLSRPLVRALRDVADIGAKAIVMLNRRGMALMALCRSCGWVARCTDCDVPMVIHTDPEHLECHHCGLEQQLARTCPLCGAVDVARQGYGTRGLEQAIARAAPGLRRVRLDAETSGGGARVAEVLRRFAAPGPAVLLGTQMVAKGHDLPDVALAGVVEADAGLARADFRAEERTFGLIVQLRGRAGRRGQEAKVIVQAWEPTSRAIQLAAQDDVAGFLEGEIERRREHAFPPWGHLVRLVLDGPDADAVSGVARAIALALRDTGTLDVRGPARLHRLRGRHRRAILVASPLARPAADAVEAALARSGKVLAASGVRSTIDVDPQET